jgi:predicted enzyme related to lactoylglutathione lyase
MMSASSAVGRFVWFELMTTDVDAAIDFYGKVIGWTIEAYGPPGPDAYKMWKNADGHTLGGVMKLPQQAKDMGAPTHWVGNLCVANCDAAAAKTTAEGGMIFHGPFDVPNIGRVAVGADPTGATLCLFQPAGDAPGHDGQPKPGEVCWSELMTSDVDKALNYYHDLVGWDRTDAMDMGPMGTYQMFGPHKQSIGGAMKKPDMMPMSAWIYYVYVLNLDNAIAIATSHGGSVVHGPTPIPGGDRVIVMLDPQGGTFALLGK